jgi:hypothetical protein
MMRNTPKALPDRPALLPNPHQAHRPTFRPTSPMRAPRLVFDTRHLAATRHSRCKAHVGPFLCPRATRVVAAASSIRAPGATQLVPRAPAIPVVGFLGASLALAYSFLNLGSLSLPPSCPSAVASVRRKSQHARVLPPSNDTRASSTWSGAGPTAPTASDGCGYQMSTPMPTPGRPLLRNGRTDVYPKT